MHAWMLKPHSQRFDFPLYALEIKYQQQGMSKEYLVSDETSLPIKTEHVKKIWTIYIYHKQKFKKKT